MMSSMMSALKRKHCGIFIGLCTLLMGIGQYKPHLVTPWSMSLLCQSVISCWQCAGRYGDWSAVCLSVQRCYEACLAGWHGLLSQLGSSQAWNFDGVLFGMLGMLLNNFDELVSPACMTCDMELY